MSEQGAPGARSSRKRTHRAQPRSKAEGAAIVAAAEAEASTADDAYAAAWNAGKDAGWSPAQLRSMGYAKPPVTRRPSAETTPRELVGPSGDHAEQVADVA